MLAGVALPDPLSAQEPQPGALLVDQEAPSASSPLGADVSPRLYGPLVHPRLYGPLVHQPIQRDGGSDGGSQVMRHNRGLGRDLNVSEER